MADSIMDHYKPDALIYFAGLVLALPLIYTAYQVLRSLTSRVPGPWYSKWTGLVLKYHWLTGRRAQYVHRLHQQYGPVVRIGPDEVDFCDIDAVKTIYSVKETFRKSLWYRDLTGTRESIFNTVDVDFHRRHRRLLAGPMSESSLKSTIPLVHSRVQLAVQKIKQEMEARGAADVLKWWLFMATDVIGELTFGDSFRMLELGKENEYARDLHEIAPMGAIRSSFPRVLSMASVFPLPVFNRIVVATENVRRYAKESLGRYERLLYSEPGRVKQTLFTKLFKAGEDEKLTTDEIHADAESYIIAGSDTTANTLTYLVWSVCRRPDIRSALANELRALPDDFSEADLRDLPYLNQVISETLRLYSAAPSGLPRIVPPGGATLGGYQLDAGTTACAQAYSMHRDPAVFPDAEKFDPSRWASPTKAMKDSFMPFGRGPRVCIGQHLAYIELRLATTLFFRTFPHARVSTLEGMADEDMAPKVYFLVSPSGKRCLIQET